VADRVLVFKQWEQAKYLISPIPFVFADGGFAGKFVDWARTSLATVVHVVRLRSHDPLGCDQHHDQPHRPRRTRHTATTLALARRIMTAFKHALRGTPSLAKYPLTKCPCT
jgi:hypothetical protein